MTGLDIVLLIVIATLGHVMAGIWYAAYKGQWEICNVRIYNIKIDDKQIRREMINSLHTPIHAVFLAGFLYAGFFTSRGLQSGLITVAVAFVWAEIWHYVSHRAFHIKQLHWIHVEHHRSHINSPFTAISFSFTEKLVFDVGFLGVLALLDLVYSLNFHGIAIWYIGYLLINSFSHANFELRPGKYNRLVGRIFTSTTYHALHHSRYTNNYGLATRVLDRMLGTEWNDYEPLFDRVTVERRPLNKLREKATD
jgi:sterol desaturase/sphingolipid hydroxylase (fatty acid hydroxylase superfamily)